MNRRIPFILALAMVIFSRTHAGTSRLWGQHGELWNPKGRLPDFSYAGYHAGEEPIPDRPVVTNVLDFGAKGDGVSDNTTAFKNAIAATDNGVLLIPKGRYKLTGLVSINKSNVVLRGEGAGADGTVLYFTRHLTDLLGGSDRAPWKWGQGGLVWIGKPYQQSAIGSQRATVTAAAERGDTWLTLSSVSGISVGNYVALRMSDGDGSFSRHLHNGVTRASNANLDWFVKVKSVSGNRVELYQPLRFDVQSKWDPRVYAWNPVTECGLENLRLEFPDVVYPGLLAEYGYNGVAFNHVLNCWMSDVDIKNADNGFSLENSKHVTVGDWRILGRSQGTTGTWLDYHGHHVSDLNKNACDNLLTDFEVRVIFFNSLTVSHEPSGNVIRNGIGKELQMDHHKYNPFENLYTNIHVGKTGQTYFSGGPENDYPHSAARGTFWNNSNALWEGIHPDAPPWDTVQTNVVPCRTNLLTTDREWLETVDDLEPKDLYISQLARRVVVSPDISPPGGTFTGGVFVSLATPSYGADIRYTTNGSTPTVGPTLYNGPVRITSTGTFKAVAIRGDQASRVASAAFTVTADNAGPAIKNIYAYNRTVRVVFDEDLEAATAGDKNNYAVNGLSVLAAETESNGRSVTLKVDTDIAGSDRYQLGIDWIKDLQGNTASGLNEDFFVLFYEDFEEGGRLDWRPGDAGAWGREEQPDGNCIYRLKTSNYNPVDGRPGQYSVVTNASFSDVEISLKGNATEAIYNSSAEYGIIFGFTDYDNFHYLLVSNRASYSRLYRVTGGTAAMVHAVTEALVKEPGFNDITVTVADGRVKLMTDGAQKMDVSESVGPGMIGVCGYNDLADFDDILIRPLGALSIKSMPVATRPLPVVLHVGPNPCRGRTGIRLGLEKAETVSLAVFALNGTPVARLLEQEPVPQGTRYVSWDTAGLESGVYLMKMIVGSDTFVRLVILAE